MFEDKAAIAVLGPGRVGDEDDAGDDTAEAIGDALARAGYVVLVHGDSGTAAAAARGASDAGGRVVAFVERGASPGGEAVNGRSRRLEEDTILRSLEQILEHADALLLLPGDLSALATLLEVWSYGHTRSGPYRPLLLVGSRWPGIVKVLADAADLDRRTRAMVSFADDPEEAVEALRYYISP